MNKVLKKGKLQNYTKDQYKQELMDMINTERAELYRGYRALNKNRRPNAESIDKYKR